MHSVLIKLLDTRKYYTFEGGLLFYRGESIFSVERKEKDAEFNDKISNFYDIKKILKKRLINQYEINLICFSYNNHAKLRKENKSLCKFLKNKVFN